MNIISSTWLKLAFLFDPVQKIFNGNFWQVFTEKFENFTKKDVVDLACGTGELRKHINPNNYLGIDINKNYINFVHKRFKHYKNTKFIQANITNYALKKRYVAFLISAAHHLSEKQIEKLCYLIKDSGIKYFIIIDGLPITPFKIVLCWLDSFFGGGDYMRSEKELVDLLSKYFKIIDHGTFKAKYSFYNYPYLIMINH